MMAKTKKNTRAGATIQPLGPVRPLLAAPSPRVVLTLSLADRLVHVVGELLRGDLLVEELIEVAQQRGRLCRRERLIPRHLEIRRRLGQLVAGHSEVGSSRRNLGVEILDLDTKISAAGSDFGVTVCQLTKAAPNFQMS